MKSRVMELACTALLLAIAGCGQTSQALTPLDEQQSAAQAMQAASLLDPDAATGPLTTMPAPANRKGEWILFCNHEHTSFSPDADESVADLLKVEEQAHIDATDVTDHNSMQSVLTPAFQTSPMIMLKGMEWGALRQDGETVQGHAGLLDMDGTDPLPTNCTLDEMLAMASARHAYIVANHPFCNNNVWNSPTIQPEVSAVEVWNGYWELVEPLMHNDKALAWWENGIKQGRHLTAIGGADYHGAWYKHLPALPGTEPQRPLNLLFVTERTPEAVLDAIRNGHITICGTDKAPRVVLEADAAGDGNFSTIEGDDVPVSQIGTIPMRAHVIGGKGLTVQFIGSKGPIGAKEVTENDQELSVTVPAVPGVKDYVRVELKRHPNQAWSMTALTNPIYLN